MALYSSYISRNYMYASNTHLVEHSNVVACSDKNIPPDLATCLATL